MAISNDAAEWSQMRRTWLSCPWEGEGQNWTGGDQVEINGDQVAAVVAGQGRRWPGEAAATAATGRSE